LQANDHKIIVDILTYQVISYAKLTAITDDSDQKNLININKRI